MLLSETQVDVLDTVKFENNSSNFIQKHLILQKN